MKRKILTLLAISLAAPLAHAAPQGFEWFPRVPGPGDQLYLIANDPCTSTQLNGIALDDIDANFLRLEEGNPDRGYLQIRYESFLAACIPSPPTMDAVLIPDEVDDLPVVGFYFNHVQETQRFENGIPIETNVEETTWIENRPARVSIPPAIAGTWYSADHAEQGLLINMTAKRELLVGWTTYGADGKQRWFSGIAPTASDESIVTLTLTDTGDGKFAGQLQDDQPQKDWGTVAVEYVACGEIRVKWTPRPDTGLTSGSATMRHLTQPHDAACDLEAYAASLDRILTTHELEIAQIVP